MAAGRTAWQALREELWKELDTIVEHIMSTGEPELWVSEDGDILADIDNVTELEKTGLEVLQQWGEWRGQAQGIAYALAIMENPYLPSVDSIREKAMQRWEEGQ